MTTFSNKYKLSQTKQSGYEFEVLNELYDLSVRSDSNCSSHTRFLFELDETPIAEQYELLERVKPYIIRATYSGKKSIHFVIELPSEMEDYCKENYKIIWKTLNKKLFGNLADTACSNPSRLTRTPDVYRRDTGKLQELVYSGCVLDDQYFLSDLKRNVRSWRAFDEAIGSQVRIIEPSFKNTQHNGLCQYYEVVTRFLNKNFPNTTGNGVSSKWLYAAIKCCQKYNDASTLTSVLEKARREHWTEQELNRILESKINH